MRLNGMTRLAVALTIIGQLAPAAAAPPATTDEVRIVLERYYAAIDRGDFRNAYRMYGGMQDYDRFREGYARTARVRVVVAPYRIVDDATNASVDVYAVLKNGRRQHIRGNYSLLLDAASGEWRITAGCLSTAGRGGCAYKGYRPR